jgi:demethylmacrocin O-methyltransferase
MRTLIQIIKEYNLFNIEHLSGTDKQFVHYYVSNFYQNTFKPIQQNKIHLFEIGTCTGASLKMWKEFFVNGKVEGVDISDRRLVEYIDSEITYHHVDAYEQQFVNSLPNFDIIIDDGPHTLGSQLAAINQYYPKLKDGGIFVIEDIESDDNIRILSEETQKIFGKPANIIDKRVEVGLSNEVLLWLIK